ncbi:unnamed protein product [Camellia sinensis]
MPPTGLSYSTLKQHWENLSWTGTWNGTFPAQIGNLSNLVNLGTANSLFTPARILPELGKLNKLEFLWMSTSNLIGKIPESFANLLNLQLVDMSFNSSKTLSIEELDYCEVFTNQLSGEIPTPIESLNLIKLNLSQNKLTGSIPQRLFQLKNLSFVWLFRNQLSGEIPIAIESPNLIGLDLSENNLTGEILTSIESLNLNELDLSENNLTGSIPMDF